VPRVNPVDRSPVSSFAEKRFTRTSSLNPPWNPGPFWRTRARNHTEEIMSEDETTRIFENIRRHAVRAFVARSTAHHNLHLDERIYTAEEVIGPEFQKIVAEGPTILVFADDDPLATFPTTAATFSTTA